MNPQQLSQDYQTESIAYALSHRTAFLQRYGDGGFVRMAMMIGVPTTVPAFRRDTEFFGSAASVLSAAVYNSRAITGWHGQLGFNPLASPCIQSSFALYDESLTTSLTAG